MKKINLDKLYISDIKIILLKRIFFNDIIYFIKNLNKALNKKPFYTYLNFFFECHEKK